MKKLKRFIITLITFIVLTGCSEPTIDNDWLNFEIPKDIQKLHNNEGKLQTVDEIYDWVINYSIEKEVYHIKNKEGKLVYVEKNKKVYNIKYERYENHKKSIQQILKDRSANCADKSLLIAGLSYKLLNKKVDLSVQATTDNRLIFNHCEIFYNGKHYGKKAIKNNYIVPFDNIKYYIY